MKLNVTLPSETIQGIAEDIYKRVELDVKEIQIDTLCEAGLTFSTRFGTYTGDDTVKIKDVFGILNEMIEGLTEDGYETKLHKELVPHENHNWFSAVTRSDL